MTVCSERSAIEPLSLITRLSRAVLAHTTCKANARAPFQLASCLESKSYSPAAISIAYVPVSAYAHGHVSIIRARSDASLGIGILTIDSNKVQ